MALAIRLNKTLNLAPDVRRLSGQDYRQLDDAQHVIDEARTMAETIKKDAQAIYQQKKTKATNKAKNKPNNAWRSKPSPLSPAPSTT